MSLLKTIIVATNNLEVLETPQKKTRDPRTKTSIEIEMEKAGLLVTLPEKIFQNIAINVVRVII